MAHLVFQTAFPGDVFLSIPLLKRIKIWEPEARLVLACRPGLGEFFLKNGLVDEVIEVDKRSAKGRARALSRMRSEVWDVVFVPHQSFRTALWMMRVKAARGKVAFRRWWNFLFFQRRVVKPMDLPEALRQLSLLTPFDDLLAEEFGSSDVDRLRNPSDQKLIEDFGGAPIPEWASMRARSGARAGGPHRRIFLAPGSVWATKRWTAEGYADLARLLLAKGYDVRLVGSPAERSLCESIAASIPDLVNHAGETSLAELVELVGTGDVLVCNDSGAMHAAASAEVPIVAIFGPTVLAQGFRPWTASSVVVQRSLECRPCGRHGGNVCPIRTHACMREISATDVLAAVERMLVPNGSAG